MKNFISLNGKQVEISDETAKNLSEQFTKKKIEIKSIGGSVLYTSEKATIKEAVEEAVENDADLSSANLVDADLSSANLVDADLSGADLSDADLSDANLRDANLRNAYLSDANLSSADLRNADLSSANLSGAELNCAKFYGRGGKQKLTKKQVPVFLEALGFIIE